ncbi:hypothetical protein F7647_10370 [Tenacibaculum piscium]|uniref:hypothetical protein n=1 Tax=Tenacibaculum piscium TaxID=1458515 RepID=UPI00187B8882|nr:hypothetical protein [Tenacibaculum piscium]MBE7686452.1 hypothetical protein [Tenacibaculum piscium]
MKDILITKEVKVILQDIVNSSLEELGIKLFSILIIVILIIYFFFKLKFNLFLKKRDKKLSSDFEKERIKNIEIWKHQKDLMFEFVVFLEENFFSNDNLSSNLTPEQIQLENKRIFKELNTYYGKLYLVMDTHIIEKINFYINGTISNVQRYYLYKELRKQLMRTFDDKFDDKDCPYILREPNVIIFYEENGQLIQKLSKDIFEVKEHYSFVELDKDDKGKIKSLPFFSNK